MTRYTYFVPTQGGPLGRTFTNQRAAKAYAALMRREGWPASIRRTQRG